MNNTLFLRPDAWDLCPDAAGNIAMTTDPYATAQNVANALRLFKAEAWYDQNQGMPYWQEVLGQPANMALFKARAEAVALNVQGVASAICGITGFTNRQYTGYVQITDNNGQTLYVQL